MTNSNSNESNKNNTNNTKNASSKRDFILTEDVKSTTVKDIIMGIIEINRRDDEEEEKNHLYIRKPIRLIVNTYGGSVYDGMALVGVIDSSETPVHTYLYGKAMSMGFIIFASGHRRFMHPLATLMYHEFTFGAHDKIEGVEQSLEQNNKLMKRYDNYITQVSNVPQKKMDNAKRRKKDWYIFVEEAMEYGLVDEIITSKRAS